MLVAVALSAAALAQPSVPSANMVDITAIGPSLFLALGNGTVVSLEGGLRWSFSTSNYGFPVHLEAAPPHGLLVLTDRAWLGLLALDKRSSWLKLALDPNSIKPETSGVIYANGTALVYARSSAIVVNIAKMGVVWSRSIINRFTDYSLSPSGDAVLLAGFNTQCYACVMNDEKIIVVHEIESDKDLFSTAAPVSHLKAASVLWRSGWLVLVQWDAVRVYDLAVKDLSSPVRTYTLPHPHNEWLSYGFSPSGGLFYYTRADGEGLGVYVLDIERGVSKYMTLPIPAGRKVLSQLGDDWKLAVASYDPTSGAVYCALLDAATGEMCTEKLGPTGPGIRIKLLSGTAAIIVGGEVMTLPRQQRAQESGSGGQAVYSVVMKVLDDGGTPLQGALVCANSTCATTLSDGVVTLELARGLYTIEVSHPLAEPYRGSLSVSSNLTVPLIMTRLFSLTVKGVLESGRQPPFCSIALAKKFDQVQSVAAPNCTASFRVPRGSYAVTLQFVGQRVEQRFEVGGDTILLIQLREGLVKLSVEAVNASGAPVANATITVLGDGGETVTALAGRGTIAIKPGRYTVRVEAPGYANWSAIVEIVGDTQLNAVLELKPKPSPRETRSLKLPELIATVALSSVAGALIGLLSATLGYCLAAHARKLRPKAVFSSSRSRSGESR